MTKRKLGTISFLFALVVFLSACNLNVIRGSGDLIKETRNVSNFDQVSLSGSGIVIITQNGEQSLVVETDDNIMEHITSEVRGSTLELGFDSTRAGGYSPTKLIFTLNVDDLNGLNISGSGDISAESIETENIEIDVSGSGKVKVDSLTADTVDAEIGGSGEIDLAGIVTEQNIAIGGSGKYRTEDLRSETVVVDIGGSGDATVWATNSLNINIGGSGSVNYYGTPAINSSIGGSGSINNMGEKG